MTTATPSLVVTAKLIKSLQHWESTQRQRLRELAKLIDQAKKRQPADGHLHERSDRPGYWYIHHRQTTHQPRRREFIGQGPDAKAQGQDRLKAHQLITKLQAEHTRRVHALRMFKDELATALQSAEAEAQGQRLIGPRW